MGNGRPHRPGSKDPGQYAPKLPPAGERTVKPVPQAPRAGEKWPGIKPAPVAKPAWERTR